MSDLSPEQLERGLQRLNDTLSTWGPVCAALVDADRALREARFILLGGGGTWLERQTQAVRVLERGIERTQRELIEDGGW